MVRKGTPIYQIKVTLKDIKPPVWRRIAVPENTTLLKLHDILQIVMGWQDYHLHMFTFDGENYGDPAIDEWGDMGLMPERKQKLGQLIHGEGQRFTYEYDFGDGWIHVLRVEKIGPAREGVRYPTCMAGRRATPPEDVGGVWGYEVFLEAIRDPDHPEHEEYLTWIGGEFDPNAFDIEAVNEELRSMGRGRSPERLDDWSDLDGEVDEEIIALAEGWIDSLPPEQQAMVKALPLRRDVVSMLVYLRDHKVVGTSSLGNFPLKAVREICAQFVEPPILDHEIGEKVYRLKSESDVWPLYFRHVLASVAKLIEGGPGKRWQLTPMGEAFLRAYEPAQVWVLWVTWWTRANWAIASRYEFAGEGVPRRFIWQTRAYLLGQPPDEWVPFEAFADGLIEATGLTSGHPDPDLGRTILRTIVRQMVVDPLADLGGVERDHVPHKTLGAEFPELVAIRVTPFGRGLLQALPIPRP